MRLSDGRASAKALGQDHAYVFEDHKELGDVARGSVSG